VNNWDKSNWYASDWYSSNWYGGRNQPPDHRGIEFTCQSNRLHFAAIGHKLQYTAMGKKMDFSAQNNKLHYATTHGRLHYTAGTPGNGNPYTIPANALLVKDGGPVLLAAGAAVLVTK